MDWGLLVQSFGLPLSTLIAATIVLWKFISVVMTKLFEEHHSRIDHESHITAERLADKEREIDRLMRQLESSTHRAEAAEILARNLSRALVHQHTGIDIPQ